MSDFRQHLQLDPAESATPADPTGSVDFRFVWAQLADRDLLNQCETDTYRASGPGGQKRNKTSSAVRLRHQPSGIIVIAEESRSQHENKAKALIRLRRAFFLHIRNPMSCLDKDAIQRIPVLVQADIDSGRLAISPREKRFWPTAAIVLDIFVAVEGQLSTAASLLGISTAQLGDFLLSEPKVNQEVNRIRTQFGHKILRSE